MSKEASLTDSGTLVATDADRVDAPTFIAQTATEGAYGVFTLTESGDWTYTLDSVAAQPLRSKDNVTESFTAIAETADGETVSQRITVNVTGRNTVPTEDDDAIDGTTLSDEFDLLAGSDTYTSGGGVDTIKGGDGDDTVHLSNPDANSGEELFAGKFDGGADIDDLHLNGEASDYRIFKLNDTFKFFHQDYASENSVGRLIAEAKNIEKFEGQDLSSLNVESGFSLRATKANGTAPADMKNIRDFDGNDLGAGDQWKLIGQVDVEFDGDVEYIYINQVNGRWATVGPDADGNVDFGDHGQGGGTRIVGIYIDPEVEKGNVVKGSATDSQQRFQNDLNIDNLTVIDAFDFDGDGFQEIYFRVNDGTAYLRALMHADGNIQYANYQSAKQVEDSLTSMGYGPEVLNSIVSETSNSVY